MSCVVGRDGRRIRTGTTARAASGDARETAAKVRAAGVRIMSKLLEEMWNFL